MSVPNTHCFGIRLSNLRLRLDERISVSQLAGLLSRAGLCLSNRGSEIVIHRLPLGVDSTRPMVPCDAPPEPPAAA